MSLILSTIASGREPQGDFFKALHHYGGFLRPYLKSISGHVTLAPATVQLATELILQRIAEIVHAHFAKILFVITPSSGEFMRRSSDYRWFQETLAKAPYPFLDYYEYLNRHKRFSLSLYHDHSHYSQTGTRLFAKAIAEAMRNEVDTIPVALSRVESPGHPQG